MQVMETEEGRVYYDRLFPPAEAKTMNDADFPGICPECGRERYRWSALDSRSMSEQWDEMWGDHAHTLANAANRGLSDSKNHRLESTAQRVLRRSMTRDDQRYRMISELAKEVDEDAPPRQLQTKRQSSPKKSIAQPINRVPSKNRAVVRIAGGGRIVDLQRRYVRRAKTTCRSGDSKVARRAQPRFRNIGKQFRSNGGQS